VLNKLREAGYKLPRTLPKSQPAELDDAEPI
jgi:hypothetical protein